nr:Holliday junction resolvase RecU [Paenibacillus oryzisoli]
MKSRAHANRGMGLETLIEYANQQYAAKGIAQIQKVATPWKVVRNGKRIVSAFPEKKSTVDFLGVYKGMAIAFDAKQTENKTRFPLANIEQHQIDFMIDWEKNGGIAFVIIDFKSHGQIFLMNLQEFVIASSLYGSSIPYKHFTQCIREVHHENGIVFDYLKHVEAIA